MSRLLPILVLALALGTSGGADGAGGKSVLTYHGAPDRSGSFLVPGLTEERARAVHLDPEFQAKLNGHVYAQPLFWRAEETGPGVLLAATESNEVQALDALSGRQLWSRSLGQPVSRAALPCGNIDPLGVTGTPVIDDAVQAVYVAAAVGGPQGMRHLVFALSLKDGTPLPGWPVDVAEALRQQGASFTARDQNQRGALTVLDGRLYVPYGGHFGDCGDYHGWVIGISERDPRDVISWATPARGGGVWAPGGISTDGKSLYAATGNTFEASTWMGGEAVVRLSPDLKTSADRRDFFTPENWKVLDARDLDLGGSNPVLLNVPGRGGGRALILALGKDGHAYVLDRVNLGGIGGSLIDEAASPRPIRTSPATFAAADGTVVVFQGPGSHCPAGQAAGGLTALKIMGGERPAMATAWCALLRGAGSPIVTTTDGHSAPIIWVLGAEGDNRLHAFKGTTGEPLFTGGGTNGIMSGLHHFQTLIATDERLYVGADDRIYAFAF